MSSAATDAPASVAVDVPRDVSAAEGLDASLEDPRERVDALVHTARPRLTDPARVIGAKPATFARWLFDLFGARPGDEVHDLFPGSGGITRAWHAYTTHPAAREDQPA